ncbi:hypothetical protein PTKU15_50070 [Paraburkholderia terrae]|nr:hypothetical protein PTKU15_50070 [Paraburkholderia terrae]
MRQIEYAGNMTAGEKLGAAHVGQYEVGLREKSVPLSRGGGEARKKVDSARSMPPRSLRRLHRVALYKWAAR